jgi:hypothetical protein
VKKQSLASLADEVVPFPLAASWAGVDSAGRSKCYCPFPQEHDDGGDEPALRVYRDHGYCFAEQRYFTVTTLLAAFWEADPEDAAAEALRRAGHKPAGYAHLWEQVSREPVPDRDALARALSVWCGSQCPGWQQRQLDDDASGRYARCLGLLHLVRTPEECRIWLAACKKAMAPYLSLPK